MTDTKTTAQDSASDAEAFSAEVVHGDDLQIFNNANGTISVMRMHSDSVIAIHPDEAEKIAKLIIECANFIKGGAQ